MKTKVYFLNIVFLFLTSAVLTSCDQGDDEVGLEIEQNIPEIENLDDEDIYGVDKDIDRPGNQNLSSN